MAADIIICPWCQSEIIQEPGQEPDKFCPVCDNELSGYRTLRFGRGDDEDEAFEDDEAESPVLSAALLRGQTEDVEEIDLDDDELRTKDEALLRYESTVEAILDEQEFVPECPQCREYMLETGRQDVAAKDFTPKSAARLQGRSVLEAPFSMILYMCPSCFTMTYALSEDDRSRIGDRLSQDSDANGT